MADGGGLLQGGGHGNSKRTLWEIQYTELGDGFRQAVKETELLWKSCKFFACGQRWDVCAGSLRWESWKRTGVAWKDYESKQFEGFYLLQRDTKLEGGIQSWDQVDKRITDRQ